MMNFLKNIDLTLWGSFAVLALFGLLLFRLFLISIKYKLQHRELLLLKKRLQFTQEELSAFQTGKNEKVHFEKSLSNAGITTRLQESRLHFKEQGIPKTPEKYKIITSLIKKGMDIQEISEILSLPETEARQLIKLASMAS